MSIFNHALRFGVLFHFATGLLLSDLPTPCLVLDVHTIQRHLEQPSTLPPIQLQSSSITLIPDDPIPSLTIIAGHDDSPPVPLMPDTAFVHCTVTRARQKSDPSTSFLAEIDIPPTIAAQLVLGLNNHHVGSYYWARSAGAGAAMEAPGIVLLGNTLQWASTLGPTECNSNDGKRSEWANFLRVGDTVQLLPNHVADVVPCMNIFGVSTKGRPLGSEPQVVCKFYVEESQVGV